MFGGALFETETAKEKSMKSGSKNLTVLVLAIAIFAWGYDFFFDDDFIDFDDKKAESPKGGIVSIPVPAVNEEQPERFEPRPLQPPPKEMRSPKSAKVEKELSQRAISDKERRAKEEKWAVFYKASPKCKARDSSWQIVVECANELLKANEEFERLYREGKI